MEHVINTPRQQVIMAFVATCIETTARVMGVDFSEVFERMKRLGMIEKYIYPNYETLHTESRENLAKDMIECMNRWEAANTLNMMAPRQYDDPAKAPVIQEIILSNRIGAIAVDLSQRLGIDPLRALMLFYGSRTCRDLHNKATGLYLYGDRYIADEMMREADM